MTSDRLALHGQARIIHEVRAMVDAWRGFPLGSARDAYPVTPARYEPVREGESPTTGTTRTLLRHWFRHEPHEVGRAPHAWAFKYWPHQRRAVETFVYLHEVRRLRRTESLYAACGLEPLGRQRDPWAKLGAQLATGSGKTKVMSLLVAWAHFNAVLEEADLGFGRHALIIAPGLFVRDRLLADFRPEERGKPSVFFADPVIPPELEPAWDLTVYGPADCPQRLDPLRSALVVTNRHQLERVSGDLPLPDDPAGRQLAMLFEMGEPDRLESIGTPLLERFTESRGLLVINDEAHNVGDEPAHVVFEQKAQQKAKLGVEAADEMAWIGALRRLHGGESRAGRIGLQVDLSATLFEETGASPAAAGAKTKFRGTELFRHAVVHYGLAEAIRDGIVKRPILERVEVRSAETDAPEPLVREAQPNAYQTYRNLLAPGIERWRRVKQQLADEGSSAKPILFIVCQDKSQAAEIANYLRHGESTTEDLSHRVPTGYLDPSTGDRLMLWTAPDGTVHSTVLEIHVGRQENANEEQWNRVRAAVNSVDADAIPDPSGAMNADGSPVMVPNPHDVVISVMMLKEGWDVRNVKVIVPLRPCDSRTLTEQVLGRGLRKIHPPVIDDEGVALMRPEELYVIEHPSFRTILDQIDDILESRSSDEITHARDYVPILQKEDDAERLAHAVRLVRFDGMVRSMHDWRAALDVGALPGVVPRLPWHERIAETQIRTWLLAALARSEERGLELTLSDAPSYRDFDHVIESAYAKPLLQEMRLGFAHVPAVKGVAKEYLERRTFALPAGVPLSFDRAIESGEAMIALGNLARGEVIEAVRGALRQPLYEAITAQRGATVANFAEQSSAELPNHQAPNEHVVMPARRSNFDRAACANAAEERFARLLDRADGVEGWVYNHRHGVGWAIPYDWDGTPARYYPDFIVRARFGAVAHQIAVEIKGRMDDRDKAKARAGARYCSFLADHDREPWHYLFVVENPGMGREDLTWWEGQSVQSMADLVRRLDDLPLIPGEPLLADAQGLEIVPSVPVSAQYREALPVLGEGEPITALDSPAAWVRLRLTHAPDRSMFVTRAADDSMAPGVPAASWCLMRRFTDHVPANVNLDGRRVLASVVGEPSRLVLRRWVASELDDTGRAVRNELVADWRHRQGDDLQPQAAAAELLGVLM